MGERTVSYWDISGSTAQDLYDELAKVPSGAKLVEVRDDTGEDTYPWEDRSKNYYFTFELEHKSA